MTHSYTQISQYLTCPRRYRHRYLDGWKEKDTRAAMLFGRGFELALGAYFRREDPGDVLFREWSACVVTAGAVRCVARCQIWKFTIWSFAANLATILK